MTAQQQLLQIIANSKEVNELPEALSLQNSDYLPVWSNTEQGLVKVKKENLIDSVFDNNIAVKQRVVYVDWQSATPTRDQIHNHIAENPDFTVTGNELVYFRLNKYTTAGIEVHWWVLRDGKGTYGASNLPSISEFSVIKPSADNPPNVIELGEIGATAIEDAVNALDPAENIDLGNVNTFTALRSGVLHTYLWQGQNTSVGVGETATTADDFVDLTELEPLEPSESTTLFYDDFDDFPLEGVEDVLYIDKSESKIYVWENGLYIATGISAIEVEALIKGTARQYTQQQNIEQAILTDAATILWNDFNEQQNAFVQLTTAIGAIREIDSANFINEVEGGEYQLTVKQSATGGEDIDLTGFEDKVGEVNPNPNAVSLITVKVIGGLFYAWVTSQDEVIPALQEITDNEGGNSVTTGNVQVGSFRIQSEEAGSYIDFRDAESENMLMEIFYFDELRFAIGSGGTLLAGSITLGYSENTLDISANQVIGNKSVSFTDGTFNLGDFIATTLNKTETLNFPSTAANSSSDLTSTVAGAEIGDAVSIGVSDMPAGNVNFIAWVSATNTVTIRFCNNTSSAIDPNSQTFKIRVIK